MSRELVASGWFWTEIDLLRDNWDVLRHPFYERWSRGELAAEELRTYASQYDHAVVAIAAASARAADLATPELADGLRDHALEEREHIAMWRRFARATGWGPASAWYYGSDPLDETLACASAWEGDGERGLAAHLVTLYAIESAQPRISRTKLDGLRAHYGFSDGSGTEYFRVHMTLDDEHAALGREALERLLEHEDPFALLGQVEVSYRAYWQLLDALERVGRSA